MAARITETMRNAAYRASIELAREKGAFPRFDASRYLAEGSFVSRLPKDIQDGIRDLTVTGVQTRALPSKVKME